MENSYPEPRHTDRSVEVDGVEIEPGDYLNKRRINRLNQTMYTGMYVTDIKDDSVSIFVLRDEKEVTVTVSQLADHLNDDIFPTDKKWSDKE